MIEEEKFDDIIEIPNVMSQSSVERTVSTLNSDSDQENYTKVFKELELERMMKVRIITENPNFKFKMKMNKCNGKRKEIMCLNARDQNRRSSSILRNRKIQKPRRKDKNKDNSELESAMDIPSARYEEIEKYFKCGICSNLMNLPVLLECSHRFCNECIKSHSQSSMSCPECFTQIKKDYKFIVNDRFRKIMKITRVLKKLKIKEENLNKINEESKNLSKELNYLNNLSYGYGDKTLESIVLGFRRRFVPNVEWKRNDLLNNKLLFTEKTANEINKLTGSLIIIL